MVAEDERRGAGAALAPIDGLLPPVEPEWALTNWQSYCVRLPEGS